MSFEKVEVQETRDIKTEPEIRQGINKDIPNNFPEKSIREMEKILEKIYQNNGFICGSEGMEHFNRPEKNPYQMNREELMDELGIDKEIYEEIKKRNGVEKADKTYNDVERKLIFESFDDWIRHQYALAKKFYSHSESFEAQSDREQERYNDSERNGESAEEKVKHGQKSRDYYAESKKYREKADAIMDELSGRNIHPDLSHKEKAEYLYLNRSLRFEDYTRKQYVQERRSIYGPYYSDWVNGDGKMNFEQYYCERRGYDSPDVCPLLNKEKRLDVLYENWYKEGMKKREDGVPENFPVLERSPELSFDDFLKKRAKEAVHFYEWLSSDSKYGYELEDLKRYEDEKAKHG